MPTDELVTLLGLKDVLLSRAQGALMQANERIAYLTARLAALEAPKPARRSRKE